MQNKGLIRLFAILFGLVSLYQLSFTYFAGNVEDAAKDIINSIAERDIYTGDGVEVVYIEKTGVTVKREKVRRD